MALADNEIAGGQRPDSGGDNARHGLPDGEHAHPLRGGSSLERGVIGEPPPLMRDSNPRSTAAEVQSLLAVRERELLTVKRSLHQATKRRAALESTISALNKELSHLKTTAEEYMAERDALKLRVTDLEEIVRRKENALKIANQRRDKAREVAASETVQAWAAAQLARRALEEAGRKRDDFRDHAQEAEARVRRLELRLEASMTQGAEVKRAAAAEQAARAAEKKKDRAALEAVVSTSEKEKGSLRAKLDKALEDVRQKQEAERETDNVIRELQAWRERVACGHVVEMSPSEVKRLRWSEEQAELMKEANASLRHQLLESGRLLAEAEHSFGTVTVGFEDAGGTITGLSVRLDRKKKELQEAEEALRASRVETSRLKKLGLSEEQRRLRGRERVLDSTQKGMEALVRGRQEETEAKTREVGKRRAAERALAKVARENESLHRRVEDAEERSRELEVERLILLEHVAAARRDAAIARSQTAEKDPPASNAGGAAPGTKQGWTETTRSLLERAVSDWSVRILFRSTSAPAPNDGDNDCLKGHESSQESKCSSSDSSFGTCAVEKVDSKNVVKVETPARDVAAVEKQTRRWDGWQREGSRGKKNAATPSSSTPQYHAPRPLKVLRVYEAPNREGSSRVAGWRWDLALPDGAGDDSDGTMETMAVLGLDTLGHSLREKGVRGEGARTAVTAVARLFDALILTRRLAAQQCAEARTELALALGRLSYRAALVSDTREAAQRASTCNRILLLRFVRSELRLWRSRDGAAAAAWAQGKQAVGMMQKERGRVHYPPGDSEIIRNAVHAKDSPNDCSTAEIGRISFNVDESSDHDAEGVEDEEEEDDANEKQIGRSSGVYEEGRSKPDPQQEGRPGKGGTGRMRHPIGDGLTLDLSNVGLDDETLHLVVRLLRRRCTDRSQRPAGKAVDQERGVSGTDCHNFRGLSSSISTVRLTRLLLGENNLTDRGTLALRPLVEASASLVELDLRGNRIGKEGEQALKKALTLNPWVHRVTSEEVSDGDAGKGFISSRGVILRAKRRPQSSAAHRARAYAFERIPPSTQLTHRRATVSPGKFAECQLDQRYGSDEGPEGGRNELNDAGRAPAHGGSVGCLSDEGGGGHRVRHGNCDRHLTTCAALESSTNVSVDVAPLCKIDLRGCSGRLLELPLGTTDESQLGVHVFPLKLFSGRAPGPQPERRQRGRGGQGRGPETRSGHVSQQLDAPSNGWLPADLVGSRTRSLRHTHRRRVAIRDDDFLHAPKSEALDMEELSSLLSMSRRMLGKSQRFEETENRLEDKCSSSPQGLACASRSPRSRSETLSKSLKPRRHWVPPDTGVDRTPSTRRVNGRRTAHRSRWPSTSRKDSTTACIQATVTEKSRECGGTSGSDSGKEDSNNIESIIEMRGGQPAVTAVVSIETAQSKYQAGESVAPADVHIAANHLKEATRDTITQTVSVTEGDDTIACGSNPLTEWHFLPRKHCASDTGAQQTINTSNSFLEGGEEAAVEDASAANGIQDISTPNDDGGWIYDEGTSSWYAPTTLGCGTNGDGWLGDNGKGWRYDEQNATWYQDESLDASCKVVPAQPKANTDCLGEEGNGATGDGGKGIGHEGSRGRLSRARIVTGSCTRETDAGRSMAVRSAGSENEDNEAGELVAKRIEELEFALRRQIVSKP